MRAADVLTVLDALAGAGAHVWMDGGGAFHYPPPVTGLVGGREVPCVDVHTQVRCHTGYEPTAEDRADMARLGERFGLTLPPPYEPA